MSDSELNSNELLSRLGRRERVVNRGRWYYPQWRLPLTPFWFHFECSYGVPCMCATLKDAVDFFKKEDVKIYTRDNPTGQGQA